MVNDRFVNSEFSNETSSSTTVHALPTNISQLLLASRTFNNSWNFDELVQAACGKYRQSSSLRSDGFDPWASTPLSDVRKCFKWIESRTNDEAEERDSCKLGKDSSLEAQAVAGSISPDTDAEALPDTTTSIAVTASASIACTSSDINNQPQLAVAGANDKHEGEEINDDFDDDWFYDTLREEQNRRWADERVAKGVRYARMGHRTSAIVDGYCGETGHGGLSSHRDRDHDALRCYDSALEQCPNHVAGLTARGALLANRGDLDAAAEDLRTALSIDANAPNVTEYLEQVERKIRERESARDISERNCLADSKKGDSEGDRRGSHSNVPVIDSAGFASTTDSSSSSSSSSSTAAIGDVSSNWGLREHATAQELKKLLQLQAKKKRQLEDERIDDGGVSDADSSNSIGDGSSDEHGRERRHRRYGRSSASSKQRKKHRKDEKKSSRKSHKHRKKSRKHKKSKHSRRKSSSRQDSSDDDENSDRISTNESPRAESERQRPPTNFPPASEVPAVLEPEVPAVRA